MKQNWLSKQLLEGDEKRSVVSLMYHSITPGHSTPSWKWAIAFSLFCDHISLLQDLGWNTICANKLTIGTDQLPSKTVLITFDDGYRDNYQAFQELAKRKLFASWFVVTKDLGAKTSWSEFDAPAKTLLSPSQLIEMQESGMEIGSHTHTHCSLTSAEKKIANLELTQSKAHLEDLLNKPVISLAYPYGHYNNHILSLTKSAGYQTAFTSRSGSGFVNNDLLQVRRIAIMANDSLSRFIRKLFFASNDASWKNLISYGIKRLKNRTGIS